MQRLCQPGYLEPRIRRQLVEGCQQPSDSRVIPLGRLDQLSEEFTRELLIGREQAVPKRRRLLVCTARRDCANGSDSGVDPTRRIRAYARQRRDACRHRSLPHEPPEEEDGLVVLEVLIDKSQRFFGQIRMGDPRNCGVVAHRTVAHSADYTLDNVYQNTLALG